MVEDAAEEEVVVAQALEEMAGLPAVAFSRLPVLRHLFLERGRKRMKEWGEVTFMEKVGESPGQDENFGANAFTKSRFLPEIRPFEKKSRDKIFPNSKYIFLFIELSESYFAGHF